jgi:hypothetical protein
VAGGITASPGIDPTVPSTAWMYDFWLGGKNHFAVDRTAALDVSIRLTSSQRIATHRPQRLLVGTEEVCR